MEAEKTKRRVRGKAINPRKPIDERIMAVRSTRMDCLKNCRVVAKSGLEEIRKMIKDEISKIPKGTRGRKKMTEAEKAEAKKVREELKKGEKKVEKAVTEIQQAFRKKRAEKKAKAVKPKKFTIRKKKE